MTKTYSLDSVKIILAAWRSQRREFEILTLRSISHIGSSPVK